MASRWRQDDVKMASKWRQNGMAVVGRTNISRCSPSARCSFFLLRFPVRCVFVFVFVGASSPLFRLDESLNRQVVESEDCKSFPVSTASGSPPPTHILSYREKSSKDSPFSVVNSTGKSDTSRISRVQTSSIIIAKGVMVYPIYMLLQ